MLLGNGRPSYLSAYYLRMLQKVFFIFLIFIYAYAAMATNESEVKKTYIEDIFIWKMSDELKLTAKEEKKFSESQKNLNKKKSQLNKQIQENLSVLQKSNEIDGNQLKIILKETRKLINEYSLIPVEEFDQMKSILGEKKFAEYLYIKSELNNKVKIMLTGEKTIEKESEKDKKETVKNKLPPPQVIIEKNE